MRMRVNGWTASVTRSLRRSDKLDGGFGEPATLSVEHRAQTERPTRNGAVLRGGKGRIRHRQKLPVCILYFA